MTRRAYAVGDDGKTALMFPDKALRDFFIGNVGGFEKATCDQYRKVERKESRRDEWGNELNLDYNTIDMSVAEYWDGEWSDAFDKACELNLL